MPSTGSSIGDLVAAFKFTATDPPALVGTAAQNFGLTAVAPLATTGAGLYTANLDDYHLCDPNNRNVQLTAEGNASLPFLRPAADTDGVIGIVVTDLAGAPAHTGADIEVLVIRKSIG